MRAAYYTSIPQTKFKHSLFKFYTIVAYIVISMTRQPFNTIVNPINTISYAFY